MLVAEWSEPYRQVVIPKTKTNERMHLGEPRAEDEVSDGDLMSEPLPPLVSLTESGIGLWGIHSHQSMSHMRDEWD